MGILDMSFFRFIGIKKRPKARWSKFYKKADMTIDIPNMSIYEFLKIEMPNYRKKTAISYFDTKITYEELFEKIDKTANAFHNCGIRKGDIVTVLSANIPEAIYSIYALNKIGAVANVVHPLSSENEIKEALQRYSSVILVAMDITYKKIKNIIKDTEVYKTIIISAKDSMGPIMKIGYMLTQGFKTEKPRNSSMFITWKEFIKNTDQEARYDCSQKKDTPAIILHSGGTSGKPKGIVLSNGNFIAATIQSRKALPDLCKNDTILAIMPIFHGFGLSVSITDAFFCGAKVVLVPTFKASEFDKLLTKYKPTVLVGVPTLFEALTTNERMRNVSLAQLKYVIAGGDTLNKNRVMKINDFLHEHGAKTNLTQGYGMTEAVAAVCFDIKTATRPGSVGIPWPGTYVKIVDVATGEELGSGKDGEICICGPTVMLGYYNNEKETNEALRIHSDGNIWLHSGDIGMMDSDGYVYYKQRLKRMIVTSGYNVYPSQIEEVLEKHPAVVDSSVVGIPHPYKVEVAKAFIALKKGYKDTPKLREELIELCKKNLATYSIPKEFEFRKSLPKTMLGKVDFRKLQQENIEKRAKIEKEKQEQERK